MTLREPADGLGTDTPSPLQQCPECKNADKVAPLDIHGLSPGVQYWRCANCGAIWSTDEYREKSIFSV
jgi:hypothetical protein